MKKYSRLVGVIIIFVFGIMPLCSLSVNYATKAYMDSSMNEIVKSISQNEIKVLKVDGRKTSHGMLYVQNAWLGTNVIRLEITPKQMVIKGDTLNVTFNDDSEVFQGAIMLANINQVIRNSVTHNLKEY